MRRMFAVVAAGALLAGCATTVPGTPTADPSALAALVDAGSFPTTPRTVGPADLETGRRLEGYRMLSTVPLLSDVAPSLQYNGNSAVGTLASNTAGDAFGGGTVSAIFGSGAQDVFAAREVGVLVGANDSKVVAGVSPKENRGVSAMVIRMPSEAAATAAVADPRLLAADKTTVGSASPAKTPTPVPGYPKAVGYSQAWTSAKTSTVGFLAYKQYVLGIYGDLGAAVAAKFFDLQTKGLDGFTPTPVDKFSTLPTDSGGIVSRTLPAKLNGWSDAHGAAFSQTLPTQNNRDLQDAGVDLVGYGATVAYRARDDKGAELLRDRFIDETRAISAEVQDVQVKGVSSAKCLTYKRFAALSSRNTYCVVTVGRYMGEISGNQPVQIQQATAAVYLILRAAK